MGVTELETRRKGPPAPTGEEPEEEVVVPPVDPDDEEHDDEQEDGQPTAEAPKPIPPMQIPIPGTWDGIGTEFGGDPPDRSEIRLLGGKMPIDGSFPKGAEFEIVARVKITGVLGQDTVDAFGEVGGTIRRHHARLISVRKV